MCRLRLALWSCCGCMLLLIFIFTWTPLKEKIPGEQVARDLLSWDCEKLFQFIPKEKLLLLLTGVGWRVLGKLSLDCAGDGDGLIFFSATVEVEYLYLDIADDIANISSSLPESYASSPRSELCSVMFFFYFTFWKSKRF